MGLFSFNAIRPQRELEPVESGLVLGAPSPRLGGLYYLELLNSDLALLYGTQVMYEKQDLSESLGVGRAGSTPSWV